MFRRLEQPDHLLFLDQQLEQISRKGNGRLMVSMPPRHGKTFTISRLFPAWYLGLFPEQRVMLVSYVQKLAEKNSRMVRSLMLSPIYQAWSAGVRPARAHEGASAATNWDIVGLDGLTGGGMDAVGVSGAITGLGAHLIIVDDPIKGRDEAERERAREDLWTWFTDDLYTRRDPGASVVVVMTRWHTDDLIGRLIARMPGVWHYIRLPALAEAGDPLGREIGTALWEARFPRPELEATRATMGEYAFAGLYQQNPVPLEGKTFPIRKITRIDVADQPHDPIVQSARYWDLAYSERANADYSVGARVGKTARGHLVIMDIVRVQQHGGKLVQTIRDVARHDSPDVPQGVENAAGGANIVRELLRSDSTINIRKMSVRHTKAARAMPFAIRVYDGMVSVVNAAWTRDFLEELKVFPNGAHDDQVDAVAGALAMLDERASLTVSKQG